MNQNSNYGTNDEIEINLTELFWGILEKWHIILLSGLTLALIATCYAKFLIPETFQSDASIYIYNQQADNMTYSELQLGSTLTMDYEVLIKSRTVLESVIQKLDLDMDYSALSQMIEVNIPMNTRIVEIKVKTTDPYLSRDIAETVCEISGESIAEIMGVDAVNVVEKANLPQKKCGPNVKLYTVLGAALGMLIACIVYIVIIISNDTLRTQEDVEKYLGLSVIGMIPLDPKLVTSEHKWEKFRKKSKQSVKTRQVQK